MTVEMSNSKPLKDCDSDFFVEDGRNVGVSFICPACDACHTLMVGWDPAWCARVTPTYPVWKATDVESLDTLTVTPSIDATRGGMCKFHGWITKGQVTW